LVAQEGGSAFNAIEHVSITIQDDFLERQTRAQPIAALAELIWNSLDGEATRVDVEFERGDLAGGLSKMIPMPPTTSDTEATAASKSDRNHSHVPVGIEAGGSIALDQGDCGLMAGALARLGVWSGERQDHPR
jgi:hypothetical protein